MPLGMEDGHDPNDIVLHDPKGAEPLNFRPMFVVAKRLHGSRCQLVWR